MKTKLLLILMLLPTQLFAVEFFTPLSNEQIVAESLFAALCYIDFTQTKYLLKRGGTETNPFIGKRPSNDRVRDMILGGVILHAIALYAMPDKFREIFLSASIGIEAYVVLENNGFKMSLEYNF